MNDQNGNPKAPKEPTLMQDLRSEWEKAGSKMPDPKTAATLKANFLRANGEVDALRGKLKVADAAKAEASLALAKATGCKSLTIDGVLFAPTSRGPSFFYKRPGADDAFEL